MTDCSTLWLRCLRLAIFITIDYDYIALNAVFNIISVACISEQLLDLKKKLVHKALVLLTTFPSFLYGYTLFRLGMNHGQNRVRSRFLRCFYGDDAVRGPFFSYFRLRFELDDQISVSHRMI